MGKKLIVITLVVSAFGFASAVQSNAGTEVIEPNRAPAPNYNYAPPPRPLPRPIFFAPPAVGVFVGPRYGYFRRGYGYYRAHRFYGRHPYWRRHHYWH
jgi:hypothetical protein